MPLSNKEVGAVTFSLCYLTGNTLCMHDARECDSFVDGVLITACTKV